MLHFYKEYDHMSKIFYFTMIFLLSFTLMKVINILLNGEISVYSYIRSSFLFYEFQMIDISYFFVCILSTGFMFGYRFFESKKWCIACTIFILTYLLLIWSQKMQFFTNPINYLEKMEIYWNRTVVNETKIQEFRIKYNCCGFKKKWKKNDLGPSCPSNVNNRNICIEQILYFDYQTDFILLLSPVVMWLTHIMGGIEFDQPKINHFSRSNYKQVQDNEKL